MIVLKTGADTLDAIVAAEARVFEDAWSERALRAHMESISARTLAAYEDGVFAGYLLGNVILPEGEVYRVAVLPEFRRKGVAEALLRAFLQEIPECFLEVRKSNIPARTLYEKQGFLLVGTRKKYYKNPMEDACIYKRESHDTNSGL